MQSPRGLLLALAMTLVCACATGAPPTEADPGERVNRVTFTVNDKLDVFVLAPIAQGWEWVSFEKFRTALNRAFRNLRFPVRFVGNLFQGEVKRTGEETARFVVNTTVGLLGFFDPAKGWGLEPHAEDFGRVLGFWGVPAGPYLVLPVFGPSNPRDTVGLAADTVLLMGPGLVSTAAALVIAGVNLVNTRALLLEPVREAKRSSLDYYVFRRNAYVQQRRRKTADGDGPSHDNALDDDFYDLEDDDE
jgi:phospholipid-binding lipoprotein MlaA